MATASSKQLANALAKSEKIDAKQAVAIAYQTFSEFFPTLAHANLMLEEIEEGDSGRYWLITLGYDANRALSPHQKMFQAENYRAYKTFKIDGASGKVASMKIKAIQ